MISKLSGYKQYLFPHTLWGSGTWLWGGRPSSSRTLTRPQVSRDAAGKVFLSSRQRLPAEFVSLHLVGLGSLSSQMSNHRRSSVPRHTGLSQSITRPGSGLHLKECRGRDHEGNQSWSLNHRGDIPSFWPYSVCF